MDESGSICTNIYSCEEAAKFLDAKKVPSKRDECGNCGCREIYPTFKRPFMLKCCFICSRLAFGGEEDQGKQDDSQTFECREREGREHCLLCGAEYRSVDEFQRNEPKKVELAAEVVRVLLEEKGKTNDEIAKRFFSIGMDPDFGCSQLSDFFEEFLSILETSKRKVAEEKIRKAKAKLGWTV